METTTRYPVRNNSTFFSLFESFCDSVFLVDAAGMVIDCNGAFAARFGKQSNGCIGANLYDLLASHSMPEVVARQRKQHEEVFRTGTRISCENEEAGLIWRHTISPVRLPEGEIVAVLVIVQNVLEQRIVEEEVAQESFIFRALLDGIPGSIFIINASWRLTGWNGEARDVIFGKSEDDMSDTDVSVIFHVDDCANVREKFSNILQLGIEETIEARVFHQAKAQYEWRMLYGRRIMIGVQCGIMVIGVDIAERKRYEGLWAFRLQLYRMVESCTEEKLIQALLDEAEQLTGSSLGFYSVVSGDQSPLFCKVWSTNTSNTFRIELKETHRPVKDGAISADAMCHGRRTIIHNDGASFINSRVLPEGQIPATRELISPVIRAGEVTAFFGVGNKLTAYTDGDVRLLESFADIVQDILERKCAAESEKKLQEQLQQAQKMELVGQLAGGIAHVFNNVLAAILVNTEWLYDQIDPALPYAAHIRDIHNLAVRSADMTSHLLAFARKQMVLPKVFTPDHEIEHLLPMLRGMVGDNIRIEWKPGISCSMVRMDSSQLDQIITNLCLNARDAAGAGGTITIETGMLHVEQSDFSNGLFPLVPGDYIRLSVIDNGSGIDKKTLPHIFEPFFTTKEIGKGIGLGLSTVYGIVRQNNGGVDCWSEPGEGSVFSVYLPVYREACQEQAEDASRQVKETILLVEDEFQLLKLIREILESKGFSVLEASNAEEALLIAEKQKGRISLLITDIMLPKMNGLQLSDRLQAGNPDIDVLFMSGYASDEIGYHKKLEEGVNFIHKPFRIREFLAMVDKILHPFYS